MYKSYANKVFSLLKTIVSNFLILLLIFQSSAFGLYADGIKIKPVRTTYKADRRKAVPQGFGSSIKLYVKIDEIPVLLEIPGQGDPEKIMRITLNNGIGSNWTIYELDMQTEEVRIKGPMVERNYRSYGEEDVYYGVLNAMNNLAKKAFKQVGIEYNVERKELKIDESLLLEKSGVGSGYDIEVENLMDRIVVKVIKGEYEVASEYDLATNVATIQDDVEWEGNLIWNVADAEPLISGDTAAAAVTSMSIADEIRKSGKKILGFVDGVIVTTNATDMAWKELLFNAKKKPMERPLDPDITDIVWMNRDMKSVMVKGTAGSGVRPKIYVTRDGNTYEDGEANSLGENWERLVVLGEGENKINAIVRTPDGREVESGDATVYVGTQEGEPDLILVSPRDRQVFASDSIDMEKETKIEEVKIKGQVTNCSYFIFDAGQVQLYSDGRFEQVESISFREGENIKNIEIGNSAYELELYKILIGAYKFVNEKKGKSYILRRGDFLFSDKRQFDKIGITFHFDCIPLEPDHVGLYVGNRLVLDAIQPNLKTNKLFEKNSDNYYYAEELYYVTQVPKMIDEPVRKKVAEEAAATVNIKYDSPFMSSGSILGHFDGPDNGFYCSEVSYWAWDKFSNSNFGLNLLDTMYPFRGMKSPWNSSLPAYFCEETMKVREGSN